MENGSFDGAGNRAGFFGRGMNGTRRDIRLALRRLSRQPGLVAVVILTLGLGIGAASTVFLAIDALFLRPLAYPEAERLYRLEAGSGGRFDTRLSIADGADVERLATTIEAVALVDFGSASLADESGVADVVIAANASASIFDVLGVRPALGRGFAAGEDVEGRGDVVVLSDGLWRRRYGSDPNVVGRSIRLQGVEHTIIGVLPAGFEDPATAENGFADVWVPLAVSAELRSRGMRWTRAIARLSSGASREGAAAEVAAVAARLAESYPETNEGQTIRLVALREAIWGDARQPLMLMLVATITVLLIACANLANLFLARATVRRGEISLQRAIGATSSTIFRQLMLESVLLSLAGGLVGVMLAWGSSALARRVLGNQLPRLAQATPDLTVIGFALCAAVLAALAFGLVPSLRAVRGDPSNGVEVARGSGATRIRRGARRILVASQVTMSVVLLASAALLLSNLRRLSAANPGYDPRNVFAFDLSLPVGDYAEPWQMIAFHERLEGELSSRRGILTAGAVNKPPLGTRWGCDAFAVEGRPIPDEPSAWPCADTRVMTQDYLRTMSIPLLRGRAFDESDDESSMRVVLINETLAAREWPGEDPVGRRIAWPADLETAEPWRTVIGVVGDVHHRGPMVEAPPEVYMPFPQAPDRRMTWLIRTAGDPMTLLPAIREIVTSLDRNLPVRRPHTMESALAESLGPVRASAMAAGGLAAFALLLAMVGVHGVLSFLVARQTAEFGVRMAFGATGSGVRRLVLKEGMSTAGVATAAGLVLALAASRLLRSVPIGVESTSPLLFGAVGALVLVTAFIACWLPARRAARLDPATALRME